MWAGKIRELNHHLHIGNQQIISTTETNGISVLFRKYLNKFQYKKLKV